MAGEGRTGVLPEVLLIPTLCLIGPMVILADLSYDALRFLCSAARGQDVEAPLLAHIRSSYYTGLTQYWHLRVL
jgi:hypothetical protein